MESQIYSTPKLVQNLLICCMTTGVVSIVNWQKEEIFGWTKLRGEIFSTPVVLDSRTFFVGCRDNQLYKLEINEIN